MVKKTPHRRVKAVRHGGPFCIFEIVFYHFEVILGIHVPVNAPLVFFLGAMFFGGLCVWLNQKNPEIKHAWVFNVLGKGFGMVGLR